MTTTALPDLPAADTGVARDVTGHDVIGHDVTAHDGTASIVDDRNDGLVVPLDRYRAQRHRRSAPVVGSFFLGLIVATALSLPVWALIIAAARWVI